MRLEHAGVLASDPSAVLVDCLDRARGMHQCGKRLSGVLSSRAAYAASCILFAKSLPEVAGGSVRPSL